MALIDKIPKLVYRSMKAAGMTRPAVLIKYVKGTRTPDHLAEGTNDTSNNYKARGLVPKNTYDKIGGTLVEQNDRVVLLFGASIASGQVPTTKDRITIDGVTSVVIAIDVDAAKATYVCLTRA